MANLIDNTYFIIDISLPVDEISAELTSYITRFEKEILISSLGYDLYNQFATALAGTPDQKWVDLRDGKTYVVDGITKKWDGFINTDKKSLIAYYVYFQYLRYSSSYMATSGVKVSNSENSINISPIIKQVDAYNSCVDMVNELDEFVLWSNDQDPATYANYEPALMEKINQFNI